MEPKLFKKYKKILAIDEVGRGALAGPFYVGGLLSDFKFYRKINELDVKDSKKIKESKRKEIYKKIIALKPKFKIIKFTNKEVDKFGIGWCFKRAIEILYKEYRPDYILIDGKPLKIEIISGKAKFIVDGDEKIKLISTISIISKVLRDNYMIKLDRYYPFYNFKFNKGYGTKEHILAIKKYGISKHHRLSFIKEII
jgi:ribonuclease HII